MLELALTQSNPNKSVHYLNELMYQYIALDKSKKLRSIENSLSFIDAQIERIQNELTQHEKQLRVLQDKSKIYDVEITTDNTFGKIELLEEKRDEYELQKRYYQIVLDYIQKNKDLSEIIAPSIFGVDDALISSIVNELKALYQKKATKSFSITEQNPSYEILNMEEDKTIQIAQENLEQGIKRIEFQLKDINQKIDENYIILAKLPEEELNHLRIQRQIDGLINLMDFLLEQRTSLGITAAQTSSDHQIIERARLKSMVPVSPVPKKYYIQFLMGGLVLCVLILFFLDVLNQKVSTEEDLTNVYPQKVLTKIPHYKKKIGLPVIEASKSSIAESFRSLRMNLNYYNNQDATASLVIGITSKHQWRGQDILLL